MSEHRIASWADAVRWLQKHVDELETAPLRLHDAAVGDKDALGALRFSSEFWAVLTGSPFRTRPASQTVVCPNPHPIGAKQPCQMCAGQLSWTTQREVYASPLAAALERLSNVPANSPTNPTPFVLVVALLDCGLDPERTHERLYGTRYSSEDRRKTFEAMLVLAVRKLVNRWSSGPIPKRGPISEAQANAEAA